jgi:hypothetical protein
MVKICIMWWCIVHCIMHQLCTFRWDPIVHTQLDPIVSGLWKLCCNKVFFLSILSMSQILEVRQDISVFWVSCLVLVICRNSLWCLIMHGKQKHNVCMLILPNYVSHKKQQLAHRMSQWLTSKETCLHKFSWCWKVEIPGMDWSCVQLYALGEW